MHMQALVLIDFQNEWINPDSEYYVNDLSDLLSKTNSLVSFARSNGFKIIWTRHVEERGDAFTGENSFLISELDVLDSDVVVVKHKISPFYNTDMNDQLRDVDTVIICGILTNLCVRSMASDAYDRDFDVCIVSDCCVAFDEDIHNFTLSDLRSTREEIEIVTLSEVIEK